jgi:hypothetical protein
VIVQFHQQPAEHPAAALPCLPPGKAPGHPAQQVRQQRGPGIIRYGASSDCHVLIVSHKPIMIAAVALMRPPHLTCTNNYTVTNYSCRIKEELVRLGVMVSWLAAWGGAHLAEAVRAAPRAMKQHEDRPFVPQNHGYLWLEDQWIPNGRGGTSGPAARGLGGERLRRRWRGQCPAVPGGSMLSSWPLAVPTQLIRFRTFPGSDRSENRALRSCPWSSTVTV